LLSWGLFAGKEQQNDPWSSKMTSGGAEDTSGGWDTKAKDSSCNDGGKWENAGSVEPSKFLILRTRRCSYYIDLIQIVMCR